MVKIPQAKECLKVAQRLVWFKSPKEALKDPYTFMAHVMTYRTLEDILSVKKYVGIKGFKEALENAPPGIIDKKSWKYWNLMTGRPLSSPLPKRKFLSK